MIFKEMSNKQELRVYFATSTATLKTHISKKHEEKAPPIERLGDFKDDVQTSQIDFSYLEQGCYNRYHYNPKVSDTVIFYYRCKSYSLQSNICNNLQNMNLLITGWLT